MADAPNGKVGHLTRSPILILQINVNVEGVFCPLVWWVELFLGGEEEIRKGEADSDLLPSACVFNAFSLKLLLEGRCWTVRLQARLQRCREPGSPRVAAGRADPRGVC